VTCQIIIEGRARVYVIGEDGRELSVNILGPGELFGEMALFENLPRSASVETLSPTFTLELDRTVLIRALRRSPSLALGLLRAMSSRLRTTTEDAELLASQPVAERLLRRLERLATWSGRRVHDGVVITPPMTQHELATLVGTTRESVNRALVRLRDQGKVRWEDGWITLLDENAAH
jgi:CRP/FNR family transcriptional regulator